MTLTDTSKLFVAYGRAERNYARETLAKFNASRNSVLRSPARV